MSMFAVVTSSNFIRVSATIADMSVHVKVQCRAGCGDLGDPELNYLCVDCHGDQIEQQQQKELREYLANTAISGKQESSTSLPSSVKKFRGPRPVDHAQAFKDFLLQHREQDASAVARELMSLKREIAIREISMQNLQKFMIATDEEEKVDLKEWSRYELGPPKRVPTRDVREAVELAAQLKLFCQWRKRVVQKRIEARREQLAAERGAMRKQKMKEISGSSFSISKTLRGYSKTAVEQAMPVKEALRNRELLLPIWKRKTNK